MKSEQVEWEKVLWKTQGYEDNYIHPRYFLESLRKNRIFLQLREGSLSPRALLWFSIGAFCVGYTYWAFLDSWKASHSPLRQTNAVEKHLKALKSSILVFLALMSLSPVLRTLTAATSPDSIWALSAILFSLNILLADYSSMPTNEHGQARLSSVLSMNAAISGSVVLASRLSTDMSVFALVLCSVVAFAFFPFLRRLIQATSTTAWVALTFALAMFALVLAADVSAIYTYLCGSTLVVVTFVAPAILMWAQKYKNEIRGPWDVAVPIVS